MKTNRFAALLGLNANITSETCPYLIWASHIDDACVALKIGGDWLRHPQQRARLTSAYQAGESAWMVVDEMWQRWDGVRRADLYEKDGFIYVRRAAAGAQL